MLGWIWFLVVVANIVTLSMFGWDKWRSRKGGTRVRERTLLLAILCCGWPAAWLAMSWFRHKTKKQPFRRYAMLWTVLNPFWPLLYVTVQQLGRA